MNALYYHPDLNLLISAENGSIYRVDFDGNFSVFVDSEELDGKSVLSIVHHGPTTFFGTESGLNILHEEYYPETNGCWEVALTPLHYSRVSCSRRLMRA